MQKNITKLTYTKCSYKNYIQILQQYKTHMTKVQKIKKNNKE